MFETIAPEDLITATGGFSFDSLTRNQQQQGGLAPHLPGSAGGPTIFNPENPFPRPTGPTFPPLPNPWPRPNPVIS